jgi:hypothetical protein
MGGPGSGCHDYHWWREPTKATVEECLQLDANRWAREGIVKAGECRSGRWRWEYAGGGWFSVGYEADTRDPATAFVRLAYSWLWTSTQQVESATYEVRLTATRPHFGGVRWWFLCPLSRCARRVGKLYLPPSGRYFGCRHCHGLTYTSCQESHKFDSLYRLMARKLGEDLEVVKRVMSRLGTR